MTRLAIVPPSLNAGKKNESPGGLSAMKRDSWVYQLVEYENTRLLSAMTRATTTEWPGVLFDEKTTKPYHGRGFGARPSWPEHAGPPAATEGWPIPEGPDPRASTCPGAARRM